MALHYFLIAPTGGDYHVVYQIPGTATFSAVATSPSHVLAQELADQLNQGTMSLVVPTEK